MTTGAHVTPGLAEQKDACNYSVELAKQFLTLSSAGIAFLVASTFAGTLVLSITQLALSLGGFAFSVALGLLYLMTVVGHIGREGKYDVYRPRHTRLAMSQILSFALAICVLGFATIRETVRQSGSHDRLTGDLSVHYQDIQLTQHSVPGRQIRTSVDSSGALRVYVGPFESSDPGR